MSDLAPYPEARKANIGKKTCSYYQVWLDKAEKFAQTDELAPKVLAAEDQPWELSPQGWLRHMINEELGLREYTVDMYMQEIPPGSRSGKHRHASEEMVFILEGEGYDLHWDPCPEFLERYHWKWETEPQKFEWKAGFFVYIPPLVEHQHFNASKTNKARFISNTCRTLKDIGYNLLTQIENAPEFDAQQASR